MKTSTDYYRFELYFQCFLNSSLLSIGSQALYFHISKMCMGKMNPEEKKNKILQFEANTVVQAGAGTGKTTALTALYLAFLGW